MLVYCLLTQIFQLLFPFWDFTEPSAYSLPLNIFPPPNLLSLNPNILKVCLQPVSHDAVWPIHCLENAKLLMINPPTPESQVTQCTGLCRDCELVL